MSESNRTYHIEKFGFIEDYHFDLPDGQLHGAMIHKDDAWVMHHI
jgi:hypothetical protein